MLRTVKAINTLLKLNKLEIMNQKLLIMLRFHKSKSQKYLLLLQQIQRMELSQPIQMMLKLWLMRKHSINVLMLWKNKNNSQRMDSQLIVKQLADFKEVYNIILDFSTKTLTRQSNTESLLTVELVKSPLMNKTNLLLAIIKFLLCQPRSLIYKFQNLSFLMPWINTHLFKAH